MTRFIILLMIFALTFSSCDFVKQILGKPTSKDIEKMRIEAEAAKLKQQRIQDSLELVAAQQAAAAALLLEEQNKLPEGFHIILGSFKQEGNADRMLDKLKELGYSPLEIRLINGFESVSVAYFESYHKAWVELDKLRGYDFCPEDVWIYGTNQNLHE